MNCGWNDFSSNAFESTIQNLNNLMRLDLGCALKSGAFSIRYSDDSDPIIKLSSKEESLIFFFLHLFSRLQEIGTVPAIKVSEYAKSLSSF